MHVLVLGGTGEARSLAARLAAARPEIRITLSLAGRTRAPTLPDCAARVGGFGGAQGLADWMRANAVAVLIDATHPFARRISRNAACAAAETGAPLVALDRPPWAARPGDLWTRVPDMAAAAAALGGAPRRIFLAVGRQEVAAFRAAPQHAYLLRSIEPAAPGDLPPGVETLLARGPFPEADERRLLADWGADAVVAKNSGGAATYGKIAAARALGLPVVLVDRPPRPEAVATVEAALAAALDRLDHLAGSAKRGV